MERNTERSKRHGYMLKNFEIFLRNFLLYRKFTVVNPGGRGAKRNFSPGGKKGGGYLPLGVINTCCCILYISLVKM